VKEKILKMLIDRASKYIGVTEEGGDNRGRQVEMFQASVDGEASRESWCMGFVQFCLKETLKKCEADPELKGKAKITLIPAEHVLKVWNETDKKHRRSKPEIGAMVVWNFYKNGKQTTSGHCGIVVGITADGKSMSTIEGNTGPGGDVVREGDGTYKKVRSVIGSKTMKIMGYIMPFEFKE